MSAMATSEEPASAPHVSEQAPGFRDNARDVLRALAHPAAIQGLIAAVTGTVVLLLPGVTTAVVQVVLVVALVVSAGADIVYGVVGRRRFGRRRGRLVTLLRGVVTLLFTVIVVALVVAGGHGSTLGLALVVLVLGAYVILRGAIFVAAALIRRDASHRAVRIAGGITAMAVGMLAIAAPQATADAVIAGVAVAAVVLGLLVIAWALRNQEEGDERAMTAVATVPGVLWDWIRGVDVKDAYREEISDGLYFEQPGRYGKLAAWWVMLVLSVGIATYAILADSTASVIGAMLVAPLMVPMLGLAGALVNGWRKRASQSAVLLIAGTTVAIAVSYGLSSWAPVVGALDTNSQITSRVNPTLLDMLIAIAAGAAGAYATVNRRVSASIAGVAIAVALVPPLGVVGISLGAGRGGDASGAFLLFLTNFAAIVLSAAIVFVLTGFAKHEVLRERPGAILATVVPFAALAAVILLPLMFTSQGILSTAADQRDAQTAVREWLGEESKLLVQSVTIAGDQVEVSLIGAGVPPSLTDLRASLSGELGRPVGVTLMVTPVAVTSLAPSPGP